MKPFDSPINLTLAEYINLLYDARHQLISKAEFCIINSRQKSVVESGEGWNQYVVIEALDIDTLRQLQQLGVISSSQDEQWYKLLKVDVWLNLQRLEIERKLANDIERQKMLERAERIRKAIFLLCEKCKMDYNAGRELMHKFILKRSSGFEMLAKQLEVEDLVE